MKRRIGPLSPPRRRLLQGVLATGVLLGVHPLGRLAGAAVREETPVLEGREFDLVVAESPVNLTGTPGRATTINGVLPAPTLRWREGDTVTIRVTNRLQEPTSIHWHGILLPHSMDGVPGSSFDNIAAGTTFTYQFTVRQSGTYWYHSHSGMQEQTGMYGAIVIEPAAGEAIHAERDQVVLLSDWTDEDPLRVLAKLKVDSDYYNMNRPTLLDFLRDARREGLAEALDTRQMWNEMRMNPTDLADVSAQTLTYLMNGQPATANWTTLFRPGETVRLRFINGAANTFYDVRIPGLELTVIAADGQNVKPVGVDEFRFGPGETYDVLVRPAPGAYTIFAQSMDRSGFARGTLTSEAGLPAAVPAVDAPQWLSMTDMMGDMAEPETPVRHARTEYGPSTDMRVDTPRTNLDDPGVGLRDNGRRVLTYADLVTLGGSIDRREPERDMELHLTGNMERYTWSIDGVEFADSTPIHFHYGERLRVIYHNDTMMTHPMHLHGLWCELENEEGEFQVRKHTVNVQPAQRVSFLVTADAPGRWAWHCHLMFHMDSGMFREVVVA
ncbi:MAG: copper resistance system multicopper oxidase [Betaproteobacteria bacterium HGW-Betaproteobacteria-11]|nr:MAG: copper resistance system multicopper oxidase [Betaproteobacteria bacterium HGW-Betaproteobacteria-11]